MTMIFPSASLNIAGLIAQLPFTLPSPFRYFEYEIWRHMCPIHLTNPCMPGQFADAFITQDISTCSFSVFGINFIMPDGKSETTGSGKLDS